MSGFILAAGTRPEIIKISPIIRAIRKSNHSLFFIHTGQHYDYTLSKQIIVDLGLPQPDLSFELQSSSPGTQISEIMGKLEKPLIEYPDDMVLVQGDTNSVLAASLAAIKNNHPVCHIEAGLRSYDWRMPEEHNRRMVDHISDILFAPTKESEENLIAERVHGEIHVTGNTVIDAVNENLKIAEDKSDILDQLDIQEYVLATLHRAENVDDALALGNIINGLIRSDIRLVIPLHPRTRKRLIEFGLFEKLTASDNIHLIPPQGYLNFLILMKQARFIITDSGGIQEEVTSPSISKRVLVLRASTERPEAAYAGFARRVVLSPDEISRAISQEWNNQAVLPNHSPYGDGRASERILTILNKSLEQYEQKTARALEQNR